MRRPRRPKPPKADFAEAMRRIRRAGLRTTSANRYEPAIDDTMDTLEKRVKAVLHLLDNETNTAGSMIFMILYDIENTKVRTQIAKYLIRSGCVRIQKSVYLAHLPRNTYHDLYQTLKEVQELYDNNDSLLFLPLPTDSVAAMKILGQQIELDFILDNKNTLFF